MRKWIALFLMQCLFIQLSFAEEVATKKGQFTVEYSDKSTIKDISLKNISLNVLVYYNGNPTGKMEIKTDDNQHFDLSEFKDNALVSLDVLSIDDGEISATCSGNNTPKAHDKIVIKCHSPKKMV